MKNNVSLENKNEISEYKPLIKRSKRRTDLLSNKETSVFKKQNKKLIKYIFYISSIIVFILLLSASIDIYKFFYDINEYAGYASIAIIILLLLIFVIRPIVVALSMPCFTLDVIDDENKKKINRINYEKLKKVAKNLLDDDSILDESKEKIKNSISDRKELNKVLREIYDKEISYKINEIIRSSSIKTLVSTAVSQNSKFDALTIIIINIRMIMKIVIKCGYHPTYPQLYKLIIKVFRNALVAYTIQSIKIDKLIMSGIDALTKGFLSSVPIVSKVAESITEGAANSLLTLRIGIITRKYLYEEFDIQAMIEDPENINEKILEESVIEANQSIDDIIKEYKKETISI